MKKYSLSICSALIFLLGSCGKKGPNLPPFVMIPVKIETFKVMQKGDKLILQWRNPERYVDGNPCERLSEVQGWLMRIDREPWKDPKSISEQDFLEKAGNIFTITEEKFPDYQTDKENSPLEMSYTHKIKAKGFARKYYLFSMRVKGIKKKYSAFSDIQVVAPRVVPLPPKNVKAVTYQDKILVTWDTPEANIDQSPPLIISGYNIYRAKEDLSPYRLNLEPLNELEYEDRGFSFGSEFEYTVRASISPAAPYLVMRKIGTLLIMPTYSGFLLSPLEGGSSLKGLESSDSEGFRVLAEDTFPPAPPSGLIAMAGGGIISLTWNPNTEKDLAGYKVWRRQENEEEYELLTMEPIPENSYSDGAVQKNIQYFYTLTAIDNEDNESQRSQSVSERVR